MSSLVIAAASLQAGLAAVDRIEGVMSLDVEDRGAPDPVPHLANKAPSSIRLTRVSFKDRASQAGLELTTCQIGK